MTAAVWAALLLAPLLGRDPAANTRAIQAALDAAGSRGGGTVALTEPGVYDLAAQGPNPYHPGHRYCLELRFDRVALRIGAGVTLRLADGQQTDEGGPVDIVVWGSRRGLRLSGEGTISGNTAGQRGWTRGYSQITNGNVVAGYWVEGSPNENIRVEGLTLADHFSNAFYLNGHPFTRNRRLRIERVRARDTGEGPLVMNADDVVLEDNAYENAAVGAHPGDGFELWNVTRFRVLRTTVRGRLGGSAIDLYGSRQRVVDGFTIEGGVEGVAVQENLALATYAERLEVRNGRITLAGAGTGVLTKGARVRHVTISGVEVQGGSVPQTIGFQVSSYNVDGRPSDDWRQQGPVTLEACAAHGNDAGLLIRTVAALTVKGGDYSGNAATAASDGIRWAGQGNAVRRQDTRGSSFAASGPRGTAATGSTSTARAAAVSRPRG